MKKNRMMRLASLILVLTLLTTCCISGTFAKYTTTASAADSARVAKFGVAIQTGGTLFSDAYAAGTPGRPVAAWTENGTTANGITVAAATEDDNVVAPGTASFEDGLYWGITGKPEVTTKYYGQIKTRDIFLKDAEYAIMIPVTGILSEEVFETYADRLYYKLTDNTTYVDYTGKTWDEYEALANGRYFDGSWYVITNIVDAYDYYPVVYKLESEVEGAPVYTTGDIKATSTDPIAEALTAQMLAEGKTVEVETDEDTTEKTWTVKFENAKEIATNIDMAAADGAALGNEKITWAWAYGEAPIDVTDSAATTEDKMDTVLGNLMAGESEEYVVVIKNSIGNYSDALTYDNQNKTVIYNEEIIASLKTSFEIILSVTQVD